MCVRAQRAHVGAAQRHSEHSVHPRALFLPLRRPNAEVASQGGEDSVLDGKGTEIWRVRCEILMQWQLSVLRPRGHHQVCGFDLEAAFPCPAFCWNCLAEPREEEEEEEGAQHSLRAPGHPCPSLWHTVCVLGLEWLQLWRGGGCSDPHLLWPDVPGIGALPPAFLSSIPRVQWVQDVVGVTNMHFTLDL